MWATVKKIITDCLQEDNGKWSLSRITAASVVISTITWVSIVIHHTQTLPDLTSPAVFISGGAAHYGVGKWAAFAKQKLGLAGGTNGQGTDKGATVN